MDDVDRFIVFILFLATIVLFELMFFGIDSMEEACENVGGNLSGIYPSSCRIGNEFYKINPTTKSLFEHTINIIPYD